MKARILSLLLLPVMALSAWAAGDQLISVGLGSRQEIIRWRSEKIPARLFLEGQALVVAGAKATGYLKALGYEVDVLCPWDDQGAFWVARNGFPPGKDIPGQVVWHKGKTAIVYNSSDKYQGLPDPHRYQPFPGSDLPDRYWDQVLSVRAAPAKLTPDPVIQALVDQVSSDTLTATIQRLQDFRTRLALSDSGYAAEEWLLQKFNSYGYSAQYDSFYHARSLYFAEPWPGAGYERNVLARATGAYRPGREYIVCGHLDATTLGGYAHPTDTSLCRTSAPGADDNASGSAATLEIARICQGTAFSPSITYALWAAEESYLLGSDHYAASSQSLSSDIGGVVNMDMVGWMNDDAIDIDIGSSDPFSQWLNDLYKEAALLYAPELTVYQGMGNGSDDMSFADRGYPALMIIADAYAGFNPYYHTTDETIDKINPLLYTAITKASLAVTAILGLYPGPVDSVRCLDIGDGSRLLLNWQPSPETNVAGYQMYLGTASGNYSDTIWIAGRSASAETVDGLWSDSIYYFAITAIDDNDRESYSAIEVSGIPKAAPLAPSGITVLPVASGLAVSWLMNTELDLSGYVLYRKIDEGAYDSLYSGPDTNYTDTPLVGSSKYYYKARAFDATGNYSAFSDSAYGRPITLDQGILIVDESYWSSTSYPSDAKQDSFYSYVLSDYKTTQYDYGTTLKKPLLADFGPYSTVMWHGDDNNSLWASFAAGDMRGYLEAGGNMWFAGWKPTANIRNNATYPADFFAGNMLYDQFKLSRSELSGVTDSFKMALGLKGYPDIMVDTLKYPLTLAAWGKTMRYIEALTPTGTGDTIYVMDMKNDGSAFEGRACAVRDSGKTVFFGFPLYFMDKEQVKQAVQQVMAEFGEEPLGIAGKPENKERITEVRLLQNVPNPFKQSTTINYQLTKPGLVSLKIYNIAGQTVKTLVNTVQTQGLYSVPWNGSDDDGMNVSNGVYFYRIQAGGMSQTRKMIILK